MPVVITMFVKRCEICGKEFKTSHRNQRTCGRDCADVLCARVRRTPDCDPFRPLTDTTLILIERCWIKDGYSAEKIARELKRDVSVINDVLKDIKRGRDLTRWLAG